MDITHSQGCKESEPTQQQVTYKCVENSWSAYVSGLEGMVKEYLPEDNDI